MFLGEFYHSIDNKGRITLPAKFRPQLAAGAVITIGFERCLWIVPKAEWDKWAQRISELPITQKEARALGRRMFARACAVVPDKQGRVLLPSYLREYASIDSEAVIVGLNTYLEVWDPKLWREVQEELENNIEVIAQQLASLGV